MLDEMVDALGKVVDMRTYMGANFIPAARAIASHVPVRRAAEDAAVIVERKDSPPHCEQNVLRRRHL